MKVLLPLGSLINKQEELERLDREIAKLQKDIEKVNAKLGNSNFIDRAPEEVVNKEKARAVELNSSIHQLNEQKIKVESLG